MSKLRAMVALCCTITLSLLLCMTSGCAAPAPAAEQAPAANARRQFTADAATPPAHDEEIWVVEKYQGTGRPAEAASRPGAGTLLARLPGQTAPIPFTLKHTDVKADIAGYLATVDVTQQYANPFKTTIEAIYVFPLPRDAAVTEFIMTMGQRKIRGIIRERAEARRIYQAAKAQGYVASLLAQDRPGVFAQSIANIEPGKAIDINIRYLHALDYSDGWYAYRFPMKGARDISLSLHLDAGVKIDELQVPSHPALPRLDGASATVALALKDVAQGKDFLMRYRVAGGPLKPRPLPPNHLDPATSFLAVDATRHTTTTQPSP
jgi:Ca-activated chloride channel family protein